MKIILKPLYSKLNPGVQNCPIGCQSTCKVKPYLACDSECPLSSHQAETYKRITQSDADIIFNTSATGDGKSLAAYLPGLLNSQFRIMGLYPTIELVEDQTKQQKEYHTRFDLDPIYRIDRLYGMELSRRIKEQDTDRFNVLLQSIEQKPVILTNPDIFHFITHFRYRNPAKSAETLPFALADFPDLWVFDEFHIFSCHQETAALNSMALIRQATQRKRKFLFTSATPREDFIQQLKQADFKVAEVKGEYSNENHPGYRQILQKVELEFVHLEKDTNTLDWLCQNSDRLGTSLEAETKGRGLVIVNSVALASKAVARLQKLLPDVIVKEISGRCDRQEKDETRKQLANENKPVLVVGTSAVDVGVDFKIHLLICEGSDSATVIQRLGRLGRHAGFNNYQAYVLINNHASHIIPRLEEEIKDIITREQLTKAIESAFSPPQQFTQYRHKWGALQAQGMFAEMKKDLTKNESKVIDLTLNRVKQDLHSIYGDKLNYFNLHPLKELPKEVKHKVKEELIRFRGGSTLQAAVWDGKRFYQYDLLRFLPYALVEIIDRDTYIAAATKHNHIEEEFNEKYIDVYVRVTDWLDKRQPIEIKCNRYSHKLEIGNLFLGDRLTITGHPQSEVANCLNGKKLLSFLIYLGKKSQWDVARILKLSPLFGLYCLTDGSNNSYACGFNQDAMLLEALKFNLPREFRDRPDSIIF